MKFRTMFAFSFGAALGAGVTYLLDPDHGPQRRAEALGRGREELDRRLDVDLGEQARQLADRARGGFRETMPDPRRQPANDSALAHKVESEVLGTSPVEDGKVVVDAADGVVTLRGQVALESEIDELVAATGRVEGVRDVVNLLHLPDEPAPNRPDVG